MPLMRIPYTDPLPAPRILPRSASSVSGAITALTTFLTAAPPAHLASTSAASASSQSQPPHGKTLLLTGAGISVASGLADYRGTNGTYTLNKSYKPIYFSEFVARHESRKRYWARSFLGWTNLEKARPNAAHWAVRDLGELGLVGRVITQNVDSFHLTAHPSLPTTELHGYLRALVCLTCRHQYPRAEFQARLAALNPAWAGFLAEMLAAGALSTENPAARRAKGLRTNPDGDVDVPGVDYASFRYPACPVCLARSNMDRDRGGLRVVVDSDGAWCTASNGGVLKPAVVMFGESIPAATKDAADAAVDDAGRLLVVGSSLATYSAWRLVKRARERGVPVGILNVGGVRGEEAFFADVDGGEEGAARAVRAAEDATLVLPGVVERVRALRGMGESLRHADGVRAGVGG
ncbi:uncharacterized protein K452DRAFT_249692 [Aplosporella prunicola CBS 121167]|uniref:Deacetylase sirtuin-type domain-containing protein n=1 Tax=Aplosporella prunicola CBS 121167 TaxID=1176127 RepID=A0A6A6BCN1_9PEZI|nr:uncharacterized protein K452DRAFT_249692 [Aplosporella prunicola CBS 121167]KAF2141962.1 hypothetical protein K452DRAFT_249692 [Aplosporella prunicola CBS 121167]